jgi:hypothetical protein
MKIAAHPCVFRLYNKDNPDGSDKRKYYVSSSVCLSEQGPTSDVVSGDLCVDQIDMTAHVTIVDPATTWTGVASFVFPARHWAFTLDGHATLAEGDTAEATAEFSGLVDENYVQKDFDVVAEIEQSGHDAYDDWSQT